MKGSIFDLLLQKKILSYGDQRKNSGLSDLEPIDQWLGFPHRSFPSIHVTGTNGKGSVSLKIASALEASGFRVGLYLSPHIETFRERISINGALIDREYAERFFSSLFPFVEKKGIKASFFTLLTALAFSYFRDQKVDYAVIETGLGGRLDATNVITPKLSVITSISYDHCEILGDTLEKIAFEKAGIIKKGVPVVIGPRAHYAPILAAEKKLIVPETKGFYDRENSEIARTALRELNVSEEAILKGLSVRPSCRFEIVDPKPIIFDVAHNPDGFFRLAEAIEEFYPEKKFHLVLAMGKRRDPVECVKKIIHKTSRVSVIAGEHEKLFSAVSLQRILHSGGIKAALAPTLKKLVEGAEPLLFCGSFYIMSLLAREMRALRDG